MSRTPADPLFIPPRELAGERRDWHNGAVRNKAHRLLTSGNVHIVEKRGPTVVAHVLGDRGYYTVRLGSDEQSCSCLSARDGQLCSHRLAVQLVTGEARP